MSASQERPAVAAAAPPLCGLVLSGGRSTRMHRDKAALAYQGRSQLERAMALLAPHVERAFASVRADQSDEPLRARFARIADVEPGLGPIGGVLAAQARDPQAAWLVLACDLPLLDEATLAHLVRERAPARMATAYRSSHDALPEPLCAIYEPRSRGALLAYVAAGRRCPRKFLAAADTELLDPIRDAALDNVNTPEEYAAATARLAPGAAPRTQRIAVQYYALLREQAGRREEILETRAGTPRELYAELATRHPFSLAPELLRVAVNAEFADWSTPLAAGDLVVFIPPVAGG